MKNFTNTAKIEYLEGEKTKTVYSNSVVIPFISPLSYISGEIFCRKGCRKWTAEIYEKQTEQRVFRLSGYTGKGFYFEINPSVQYYIVFIGDDNSTMRLYSIPDNVSLKYNYDHILR